MAPSPRTRLPSTLAHPRLASLRISAGASWRDSAASHRYNHHGHLFAVLSSFSLASFTAPVGSPCRSARLGSYIELQFARTAAQTPASVIRDIEQFSERRMPSLSARTQIALDPHSRRTMAAAAAAANNNSAGQGSAAPTLGPFAAALATHTNTPAASSGSAVGVSGGVSAPATPSANAVSAARKDGALGSQLWLYVCVFLAQHLTYLYLSFVFVIVCAARAHSTSVGSFELLEARARGSLLSLISHYLSSSLSPFLAKNLIWFLVSVGFRSLPLSPHLTGLCSGCLYDSPTPR